MKPNTSKRARTMRKLAKFLGMPQSWHHPSHKSCKGAHWQRAMRLKVG